MKARKKPVVIDYLIFDGTDECVQAIRDEFTGIQLVLRWEKWMVETLEGWITASIGDYIIKGVMGEFYSIKPDIFKATYELVEK